MRPNSTRTAGVIASLLVLSGCTSENGTRAQEPAPPANNPVSAFEGTPCPTAFVAPPAGSVSCGYLTVPEDRSESEGRQIRLFVARWRPAGKLATDPLLGFDELGWAWSAPEPGGGPPLPNGIGREVIQLDVRGLGRSEPSLACPEIEELAPVSLAAPSGDPQTKEMFFDAVRRCRERLAAEGIDLSDYNLEEAAADAEDLRIALGIDEWNLRGFGTGARLAFEVLRRFPEHVRAAYLDTPEIPQKDLLSTAIIGTRHAMRGIAAACADDPACDEPFPDLEKEFAAQFPRYQPNPLKMHGALDGVDIPIVWDGAFGVRAYREVLTWYPEFVPAGLYTSDEDAVAQPANWISDGPAFVFGYVPDAGRAFTFNHGAFFSTVCHDQLAFVEKADLIALAHGDPGYVQAFAQAPFFDVCRIWDVGTAAPEAREPVVSDVPTLLLVGRFGPYAPRPLVEEAAETLSASWIVEFPNEGHNVLSDACAVELRNVWLDDPTAAPDTSCVEDIAPLEFATSI